MKLLSMALALATVSAFPQPKPEEFQCGPSYGNQKCSHNQCCSHAGYCGNTTAYCTVPQNCQEAFGRCDSDRAPSGRDTSKDPRTLIGNVSYDKRINHCVEDQTIALTFDDGPSEHTSALLDLLATYEAKATFFISGNNNGKGEIDTTKEWRDAIKRMVREGHQVGSHTFDHVRLSKVSSAVRKSETVKNERVIANIIGKYPTYMRAPYTDCTAESGCAADIRGLGYHLVHYDLSTDDYLHPGAHQIQESKDIVKDAFARVPNNLLVLQHDTIPQSTANLTEFILKEAKKRAWNAVPVGTCVGDSAENWYREDGPLGQEVGEEEGQLREKGTTPVIQIWS